MPPPYQTTPMFQIYVGENVFPNRIWGTAVQYLSATGRAAYALSFSGGLIRDANGNLFDTRNAPPAQSSAPRAIFVMDSNGTFYASNHHMVGDFHHSSFLAGAAVAAAGELEVENGVLKAISNRSGHYRPHRRFGNQAI